MDVTLFRAPRKRTRPLVATTRPEEGSPTDRFGHMLYPALISRQAQQHPKEEQFMRSSRWFVLVVVCLFAVSIPVAAVAAEKESPKKEVTEGAKIFKDKCQVCHGPDGNSQTAMAKNLKIRVLSSEEVQKQSKDEIVKITTDGKGKTMPSFKSKLSKDQIDDVALFVKSLKK
jgi:mono/diheme cytochrome c family protein